MMIDDAWYILLAKSLAAGQGYQVINSPTPGILPLYPPAFPLLLSLVFRISADFPNNLYLLKAVSIAAMLALGAFTYRYCRGSRELPAGIALGIAVASVLSPPLVVLATSTVMSECVFAAAFLGTVMLVEHCARQTVLYRQLAFGLAAALAGSFTFLTRSMAMGLLAAGVLYLLWKRRLPAAVAFAVGASAVCLPWLLYARIHQPTASQAFEQGGHIVRGYAQQFWDRVAGYPELGELSWSDLPARIWNNILEILGLNIGAILTAPLFPGLSQAVGERWGGPGTIVSLFLSAIVIIGFLAAMRSQLAFSEFALPLSLLLPIIWGFPQFRYLVPFTPFLLIYFVMGVRTLSRHTSLQRTASSASEGRRAIAYALCGTILCSLYVHADYLRQKLSASPEKHPRLIRAFSEHESMLLWVKQTLPPDGVLVTQNPPLTFLHTNRKTINYSSPAEKWEQWKKLGVRYFVMTSPYPLPERDPSEQLFRTIYRTPQEMRLRVLDLGDPQRRPAWKTLPPQFLVIK